MRFGGTQAVGGGAPDRCIQNLGARSLQAGLLRRQIRSSGPKASILINNYNYGRYLRACIDSALAQTYPSTEVIVVDDGSTDDSRAIIDSYGDRILAVFKSNGGQASCFNAGFARATGDFIFLLDADDEFHRDKVAIVMAIYRRGDIRGDIQWCIDRAALTSPPNDPSFDFENDVTLSDLRSLTFRGRVPDIPAPTSGLSFRRELLGLILPMPTASGIALSDNYLKFAAAGLGAGAICNTPLTYQRIHGDNRYTHSRDVRRRRAEIMLETGIHLAKQFHFLSGIGVRLASNGIAEGVACDTSGLWSGLGRCFRGSFTRRQKFIIAARAMIKIVANRVRQPPNISSRGAVD